MVKLKKINVISLAKIYGVLTSIMGLILGLFITILNLTLPLPTGTIGYSWVGMGAVIFFPIFYGIIGFVAGAMSAWLYNLVSKYIGALELDLEK